jgi:NadR type nicotinamide-nucleotide adenylyltransferase
MQRDDGRGDLLGWTGSGSWEPDPPPPPPPEANARKRLGPGSFALGLGHAKPGDPVDFGPDHGPGQGAGLVMGRFCPPHLGHQHLIQFAQRHCARLTVLCFSQSSDDVPGARREAWLRELAPGVTVLRVHDQSPGPGVDAAVWAGVIRAALGGQQVDRVFASDLYDVEVCRQLGASYVPVDPRRTAVPVSASFIRAQPLAQWKFLPAAVRPYYLRRVRVMGPHGSGKSTLAQTLAKQLDTPCVPEYARTLAVHQKGALQPRDLADAARGQLCAEASLERLANRYLICDTDPLTLAVWCERMYLACPAWLTRAAEQAYDLTLLLPPSSGPVEKGAQVDAQGFFEQCRDRLTRSKAKFVVAPAGSAADQLKWAVSQVTALGTASGPGVRPG